MLLPNEIAPSMTMQTMGSVKSRTSGFRWRKKEGNNPKDRQPLPNLPLSNQQVPPSETKSTRTTQHTHLATATQPIEATLKQEPENHDQHSEDNCAEAEQDEKVESARTVAKSPGDVRRRSIFLLESSQQSNEEEEKKDTNEEEEEKDIVMLAPESRVESNEDDGAEAKEDEKVMPARIVARSPSDVKSHPGFLLEYSQQWREGEEKEEISDANLEDMIASTENLLDRFTTATSPEKSLDQHESMPPIDPSTPPKSTVVSPPSLIRKTTASATIAKTGFVLDDGIVFDLEQEQTVLPDKAPAPLCTLPDGSILSLQDIARDFFHEFDHQSAVKSNSSSPPDNKYQQRIHKSKTSKNHQPGRDAIHNRKPGSQSSSAGINNSSKKDDNDDSDDLPIYAALLVDKSDNEADHAELNRTAPHNQEILSKHCVNREETERMQNKVTVDVVNEKDYKGNQQSAKGKAASVREEKHRDNAGEKYSSTKKTYEKDTTQIMKYEHKENQQKHAATVNSCLSVSSGYVSDDEAEVAVGKTNRANDTKTIQDENFIPVLQAPGINGNVDKDKFDEKNLVQDAITVSPTQFTWKGIVPPELRRRKEIPAEDTTPVMPNEHVPRMKQSHLVAASKAHKIKSNKKLKDDIVFENEAKVDDPSKQDDTKKTYTPRSVPYNLSEKTRDVETFQQASHESHDLQLSKLRNIILKVQENVQAYHADFERRLSASDVLEEECRLELKKTHQHYQTTARHNEVTTERLCLQYEQEIQRLQRNLELAAARDLALQRQHREEMKSLKEKMKFIQMEQEKSFAKFYKSPATAVNKSNEHNWESMVLLHFGLLVALCGTFIVDRICFFLWRVVLRA